MRENEEQRICILFIAVLAKDAVMNEKDAKEYKTIHEILFILIIDVLK